MAIKKVIEITAKTQKAQKSLEDINVTIEKQEDLIKDVQREIEKLEDLKSKTSKKDQNRIQQYNDRIAESNRLLKRTKTRLQENKQQRTKDNKEVKKSVTVQREYKGVLALVDRQTGGLISSFKGFTTSIGGATKGLKLLRIAWIATGIGAFVTIITSLIAAFKQSEEGQEKLQRGLKMMGAVVKQVMDSFAKMGEAIIDAVTNPMKALKNLGKGIKNFLSDPIGTVTGAFKDAKDSVTGFVKETLEEVKAIDEVTKARQKAHHINRALLVERAEANREINDIRLEAEKRDKYTAGERVALLKKAQKIEEDITNKEIAAKQLLVEAQEKEMAQGLNNIASKDKLAKLQAELINLDTRKLRSQRLLQTQITTAFNEEIAQKKELKKLAEDEANTWWESVLKKGEQAEKDKEAKEALLLKTEEDDLILIEKQKEKDLAELERLKGTKAEENKIIAFYADKKLKITKERLKKEADLQNAVEAAKVQSAMRGMALIQEIAGKGSAVGKAMAVGQATISGIESVQNAFKTANLNPITAYFPAYPYIQAGLAGAFSALQIKKILSTDASGKSISGGAPAVGGGGTPAPAPSAPPAFNVVGASDSNQLAGAIASQAQTPVKTYVVANDVTTGQALERNTIEGASIG